ncbi:MAG TPA: RdgB/HAM1 family non-canonical purine NTP pyrophosphatase [Phycisphaerales bacterium]|nr:RdgB/HAM1 family non-canonical purine NTP pyrophosphatase [Phycisphaerales bacterium]
MLGAAVSGHTKRILVATTNPGKIAELSAMLDEGIRWVGLSEFPDAGEVVEDGRTFAENAAKKALGYAEATGLWTLADDSGLTIDALGGEPGVHSSRYSGQVRAGEDRRTIDRRNIEKVLGLMRDVPAEKRTARFACRLCLARPGRVLLEAEGRLEGIIATEPAGENGFGYDPIFFVPAKGRTVAQLTPEEKNAISHRGNALRNLRPLLNQLIDTA